MLIPQEHTVEDGGSRGQHSSSNLRKDSQGEVLPGLTQSHMTTAAGLSSIYKVREDPEAFGPTTAQKENEPAGLCPWAADRYLSGNPFSKS